MWAMWDMWGTAERRRRDKGAERGGESEKGRRGERERVSGWVRECMCVLGEENGDDEDFLKAKWYYTRMYLNGGKLWKSSPRGGAVIQGPCSFFHSSLLTFLSFAPPSLLYNFRSKLGKGGGEEVKVS
jgi:hypothetical protein